MCVLCVCVCVCVVCVCSGYGCTEGRSGVCVLVLMYMFVGNSL